LRAIRLENDLPLAHTLSRLRGRLWDVSPYARPPLGTEQSVAAIRPGALRTFYERFVRPDRAVIVVAGNVRPDTAGRIVRDNLRAGGWGDEGRSPRPQGIPPETLRGAPPLVFVGRRSPVTFVAAGFLAPGTEQRDDYAVLLVLDALIGGGKGGRLFRNLRDTEGIGYEIGSVLQPGRYQSLLAGYLATDIRRGPVSPGGEFRTAVNAVSQKLLTEMRSVADPDRPPTDAEIARARAYLKGRYALRHERLRDRSYLLGWSEVMGLGWSFDPEFDARIDAVPAARVQQLARQILVRSHPVLAVTLPDLP
jgi:predicted Zn-dependent peptidase